VRGFFILFFCGNVAASIIYFGNRYIPVAISGMHRGEYRLSKKLMYVKHHNKEKQETLSSNSLHNNSSGT
jgi:hypothetical protein